MFSRDPIWRHLPLPAAYLFLLLTMLWSMFSSISGTLPRSIPRPKFSTLRHLASRRAIARVLSTFLCATIIVIRPFSVFGGSSAFLALTVKELVFSVQGNLSSQIENTLLNLCGALLGVGISSLARYFASLSSRSLDERIICAASLVAISFFGALLFWTP